MPDQDLTSIHADMLSGEPTAPRRLVNACGERLYAILKHRYSVVPQETVQDAVHDALLVLIGHPERFDAGRGSLLNYLVHIGSNKLNDQVRAYQRRARETAVGGAVELAEAEANAYRGEWAGGLDAAVEAGPLSPEVEALLREILPEARDRCVWSLICDGRTAVAEFAQVLGISHLPPEEQRREVKRHRDRVQKRVTRRGEEFRRLLS